MNLGELKKLSSQEERLREGFETCACPSCGGRTRQWVEVGERIQIRSCPGVKPGDAHTVWIVDGILEAVEHEDGRTDWRDAIDHARTEGVTPQSRAWETDRRPRRIGGRKKGGGRYTSYVEDCE